MRRQILFVSLATLAVGACDSSLSPDTVSLGAADVRLLASELNALGDLALDQVLASSSVSFALAPLEGAVASSEPVPVNVTFARTVACPAGGEVTLVGTMTGHKVRETRTIVTETSATKTLSDCAVQRRNGTTMVTSGSIALTAHRERVNGVPSGLQTQTQQGSFTYTTSAGGSGACTIDIASTFDPATRTRTIKGTTCQRTVDTTVTRG